MKYEQGKHPNSSSVATRRKRTATQKKNNHPWRVWNNLQPFVKEVEDNYER